MAVQNLDGNSTGEIISSFILNVFENFQNCIAFCPDTAFIMQGGGEWSNFIKKRGKNYIHGCCCHLIYLASEKAAASLSVKVDEAVIDIFYYLKKSITKEKV